MNQIPLNHFIQVSMYLVQSAIWGHSPDQTGILKCRLFRRGKPEDPKKTLLEQGGELTTNSTHI